MSYKYPLASCRRCSSCLSRFRPLISLAPATEEGVPFGWCTQTRAKMDNPAQLIIRRGDLAV